MPVLIVALFALSLLPTETPVLAAPAIPQTQPALQGTSEDCAGWWAFSICYKAVIGKGTIKIGIKVSKLPYFYFDVVSNGCFNVNPAKVVANISYCVERYKKVMEPVQVVVKVGSKSVTKTIKVPHISFRWYVKGCIGVSPLKTCKETPWFYEDYKLN
jgi:hypothetical protein